MLFFISKFFFIFLIFINNANTNEKEYLNISKFKNWEVISKPQKDICYAISKPKRSEGIYNLRGKVSAVVAVNNNIKNKYFVGFDFGYSFSKNDKVRLIIDDKVIFELDTFAQTAWTNYSKNPKLDKKIINAMKKGQN